MSTHKIHEKLLGFKLKIRTSKYSNIVFLYIIRTWLPSNTLFSFFLFFLKTFLPQAPNYKEAIFPEPVGINSPLLHKTSQPNAGSVLRRPQLD